MEQPERRPAAGEPAPDFELESAEGGSVRLSDFRGRAHVVLHFARAFT